MKQQSIGRRLVLIGAASVFVALLSALTLSAHHGWGGYVEQLSDLNGTVTSPVSTIAERQVDDHTVFCEIRPDTALEDATHDSLYV